MVGWIEMSLRTEVGLAPGHVVLDGNPALPPRKGHSSPLHVSAHMSMAKRSPLSATAELVFLHDAAVKSVIPLAGIRPIKV